MQSTNPAGVRLFARDSSTLLGTPIEDLVHRMDRGAMKQMLAEASKGHVPSRQEIRFLRFDESIVVGGFSVAPIVSGRIGGLLVCVIRDLSDERALRPNLILTERLASMGHVASTVAHELNNPLAGALGCLELLQRTATSEQRGLLETAVAEIDRAAAIVRDLNEYGRSSEGLADRIRVPELFERFLRLRRYGAGDLEPELGLAPDLPELWGNQNQILQALLNLARNAEQAVAGLAPEERRIRILASQQSDIVVIEVVDNGPGISPDVRDRLFDPFFSTKDPGEGTGLGLTVVQSVVEGHGGRIEVSETPGGGATFRMVLPVPETAPASRAETPSGGSGRRFPPGTTVLVADDEDSVRLVLREACRSESIEVVEAADADEAIQALGHGSFDLVLLDVRMPGGGGARVFEVIQDLYPSLMPRTIFMTGAVDANMRKVVGGGYATTLPKPFSLTSLFQRLHETLESASVSGRPVR